MVALQSGKVVTGVKIAADPSTLTLGDAEGKTHQIPKSDILRRQGQPRSTMPDGLEKRLTDRELTDLIAFLAGHRKESPQPK